MAEVSLIYSRLRQFSESQKYIFNENRTQKRKGARKFSEFWQWDSGAIT